jgi:aminopeptidase N
MPGRSTLVVVLCTTLFSGALAQEPSRIWTEKQALREREQMTYSLLRSSSTSSAASPQIDVTYYFLRLRVSTPPRPTLLSGDVLVKAFNRADSLSAIVLDFMKTMTVDSVRVAGQEVAFTQQPRTLTIALDRTYHRNELISVDVVYHGIPVASGFGSFFFSTHNGTPWVWSLSEPYGARDWWPCKDHPSDKADSTDIWITCDDRFRAGSNGRLVTIVENGDGTHTYQWSERYPIATYLISIAVTNYDEFTNWFRYTPTDSMPVVNYVLPELLPYAQQSLPQTVTMLGIFSDLYGLYPFIKEKYGHASMGTGGAMEHQTMTSTTTFSEYVVAHELSHQWFGDMISPASWVDLWLNEGFASYSEALYAERRYGEDFYTGYMRSFLTDAVKAVGPLRVLDTTDVPTLFAEPNVYAKGACVLHMLRHVLDDSVFFACLRTYAADPRLRYSSATTADFRTECEHVSGQALGWFFDEWTDGSGYPAYQYSWQSAQSGSGWILSLRIVQTNAAGGPTVFRMPLDVLVTGASWDTLFSVVDVGARYDAVVNLSHKPSDVRLDPDDWVLADKTNLNDGTLPVAFRLYQNYPNPFNPGTTIAFDLPERNTVSLTVYNLLGEEIARLVDGRLEAGRHEISWDGRFSDGRRAPSGVYICALVGETERTAIKIVVIR